MPTQGPLLKVVKPHPYDGSLVRLHSFGVVPETGTWHDHGYVDVPRNGYEAQGAMDHRVAEAYGVKHGGDIGPAMRAARMGTGQATYAPVEEATPEDQRQVDQAEEVTPDMFTNEPVTPTGSQPSNNPKVKVLGFKVNKPKLTRIAQSVRKYRRATA